MSRESSRPSTKRRGFTLIEMLVALAIIAFIAGLGAYFAPTFQEQTKIDNTVDQVTQTLLIAKQQAKRDRVPTGIRFTVVGGAGSQFSQEMQFIQQPDDYAQGRCISAVNNSGTWTLTFSGANFQQQLGAAGGADEFLVNPGDYIELYGGGAVHQIASVGNNSLTLVSGTSAPPMLATGDPTKSNYRVILRARPIAGFELIPLHPDVGIDFNDITEAGYNPTKYSTLPVATVGTKMQADILFAPSGSVLQQSATSGQVYLWIRDLTKDNTNNINAGRPAIVAIQIRSGFIAAHPVAGKPDPFAFTRDARSSGI